MHIQKRGGANLDINEKILELIKMNSNNKVIENSSEIIDIISNSLEFIKVIVAIEKAFDIEFEDEVLNAQSFQTVENIVEYVKTKVAIHGS